MEWTASGKLRATLVAFTLASACAFGCSGAASADGDAATDGNGESTEEALGATTEATPVQTVDGYAAIPLDDRIVTQDVVKTFPTSGVSAGARIAFVRTLTVAGVPALLGYDARTFETVLLSRADFTNATRPATDADGPNGFATGLGNARTADATLKHIDPSGPGHLQVALTIDMCQSHKPWERGLFDFLVGLAAQRHAPTPIGIAMTGLWANAHPAELQQLHDWAARGALAITWINHSYTHPLHCTGNDCTFLTDPSISPAAFEHEVLDTERLLLRRGFAVSPLFRFPGLVHDAERRSALSGLSLFALDADAWLAIDQPIHDGAVVLLHGNGNEPRGISLFMSTMRSQRWVSGLRDGTATFVSPLRAALVE